MRASVRACVRASVLGASKRGCVWVRNLGLILTFLTQFLNVDRVKRTSGLRPLSSVPYVVVRSRFNFTSQTADAFSSHILSHLCRM